MSKPQFIILINHKEGTLTLGNDDIGLREFPAPDVSDIEWAETLRDFLEESGFRVDFDEEG